jgi:uncharacterized membrane protein
MWGYHKRLEADLRRWRQAGWVTADAETRILEDAASRGRGFSVASSLGILASVLLGFAAMSFVAAHWQDMPRLLRLGLLLSLIWAGYAAAGVFAARGHRMFADAAVLFAVAAFGANIMLISQMFHIDGNPPDGVLFWGLGALLSGIALRSNPALALAMVLAAAWSGMTSAQTGEVHWPFLVAWLAISAAFVWQRWRPGIHISAIALSGFIVSFGYLLGTGHRHDLVAVIGIASVALSLAAAKVRPELNAVSVPALGYSIAVAFFGLFALQFIEATGNRSLVFLAAVTLAMLLAAIWYGLTSHHRGALWLGYIGFSIEILSLYWKTVGSILDTSLFFLVAGQIVSGLAFMALRLAKRSDEGRALA